MTEPKRQSPMSFDEVVRKLPQRRLAVPLPDSPTAFDALARRDATVEDSPGLGSRERTRLLLQAVKDPDNQRMLGRMALELGLGVGAAYLTGGGSTPWTAGRMAALGTRMLASGAGEATGSLVSEAFDPTEQPLATAGTAFVAGALGEGLGSGAARLARGGTVLEKGGREAFEQISAQGGVLSPGLVSRSRVVDIPQNIGESSLFGGGILQKTKEHAINLATEAVDTFVRRFRSLAGKEQVEDLVRETIIERSEAFRATGKALYRDLDKAVAEAGSPVRVDLSRFVSDLEKQAQEFGNSGARRILAEWRRFAKSNGISDPSAVSFADAQSIRSTLLGIGRQGQDLIAQGAQITGKRLSPVVDAAMADAAKKAGPTILPAFRAANAFWKEGAQIFNSRLMKSLTKEEPRAVFSAIGKDPKTIRKLRTTIDNADAWREIQGQFLLDVMERSTNEVGVLSGKKILANLKRFGSEGLSEMFTAGEIDTFRSLARTLQLAEGEVGKRLPGGIFIQLQQAGAVTAIGGFLLGARSVVGPAAAIVVAPAVMARLLANKQVARYLTLGLRSRPGSQQAIRAFGQVVAWLVKEGIEAPVEQVGAQKGKPSLRFSATLQGPTREPLHFTGEGL